MRKQLPPCDPDLFEHGAIAGIYDTHEGAAEFEKIIVGIRDDLETRVDWNYAAGRAVVRCEPGKELYVAMRLHDMGYRSGI